MLRESVDTAANVASLAGVLAPMAAAATAAAAISLRSERGWTLTLPGDVPGGWLAELMQAL